jgi:NADPH-dependent 2,4-dienoyl-CoA reductase/sulfur reductase-like enzyme
MVKHHSVIMVGSGLAGLAAADLLCRHGLDVLIIDENAHTGGQLLRKPPNSANGRRRFEPDSFKRLGFRIAGRLAKHKVRLLKGTQVLGIYPENTLLLAHHWGDVCEHRADTLILATGARERYLPFKGWTLPGVMSTGAAQILMKSSGILPGANHLIGGSGPLMFVLAAEILANRGSVQAVLDQSGLAAKLRVLNAGTAVWPKLFEGALCLLRLAAAKVPVKQSMRIVEARGSWELEAVVAARLDIRNRVIQGTERIYRTDSLAVGYGFAPNIELAQQAGCVLSHSADKGGWYVDVNATMATSVTNIYAAGEISGIAGAGKSLIEGRIAAWDILYRQGRVDWKQYEECIRPLIRQRRQQVRYGRFLNRLGRPAADCYADIPDETVICRCEEITLGEIRKQLNNGFFTMNSIKKSTRCGMGHCQGRTCGPIVFDIIHSSGQISAQTIGWTVSRAPVRTVALGAVARMSTSGDGSYDRTGS